MSEDEGGRPSEFRPEFCQQAADLCVNGATDQELADFFDVSVRTLYRWKAQFQEFCQAIKVAKEIADERVERSLYHRAVGYSFDAVKITQYEGSPVIVPYREHVPPDTAAAVFWLKNRQPDKWRDKREQELTGKDGGPLVVTWQPPSES